MAASLVKTASKEVDVFGSARLIQGVFTLDATSGLVDTGLDFIYGGSVTPASAATGGFNVKFNVATAGTASGGKLRVVSGASGDDFHAVVWGR